MPKTTDLNAAELMDGQEGSIKRVLRALWENPLGTGTLAAVVVGGLSVYASLTSNTDKIRSDLFAAQQRGIETNTRQDVELGETKRRLDKVENYFQDMRAELREINTNLRWIMRNQGGIPADPSKP